jgi:hypothetical protein
VRSRYIGLLPGALLALQAWAGGKAVSAMNGPGDIGAILSCFGYGYKVKVVINGVPTKVKGGQSETMRLLNQDSELAKQVPPEMKSLFILKPGENQIQVEFTREGANNPGLTVSLELEGYPAPVFLLYSKSKASGKVDGKFGLAPKAPQNFRPVYFSDEGENKSAFVYVSSMEATVTPVLNGQQQMTLAGMPGPIPLTGVRVGKNELIVNYKVAPAAAKELKFAVVTPEWVKFLTRKITDKSPKQETFTFTVP